MNEIDFYCLKRNAYVIMPISECYKLQSKKKGKYNYSVNAIDPHGQRLTKQISKLSFNQLPCRTVEYAV